MCVYVTQQASVAFSANYVSTLKDLFQGYRQSRTCESGSITEMVQDRHTHTHPFNVPFSGTTRVSRHQRCKTNLDFTEARDSEWQWHQLGHMQVCTSLQTDNHASTSPLGFFTGRMSFLPSSQQRQSTEGNMVQDRHVNLY